jgi:hypothetical protein
MKKYWYTLKEAAELAGITFKTLQTHLEWQPLQGEPEGKQFGKPVWSARTIESWLSLTDDLRERAYATAKLKTQGFEDRTKV